MTSDPATMELGLIAGYRAQLPLYRLALQCAEDPNSVQELLAALNSIARADAEIADLKAAWRLAGLSPHLELRDVLDQVAESIRALAACVDQRIARTQAIKNELAPQIDAVIQQRRMLHAYGQR